MTGFEQTMAIVRYLINNCCFDRNGKAYCRSRSNHKRATTE